MAIDKNDYLDVNGDYDLKKGLFDQLIDFLGDGGVEESGSNYVRFKDGTQICWTTASLSKVSNYYLSGYTAFPKSFINTSYASIPVVSGDSTVPVGRFTIITKAISGVTFYYQNISAPYTGTAYTLNVDVITIGRWK